jgi:hypothetical protein
MCKPWVSTQGTRDPNSVSRGATACASLGFQPKDVTQDDASRGATALWSSRHNFVIKNVFLVKFDSMFPEDLKILMLECLPLMVRFLVFDVTLNNVGH